MSNDKKWSDAFEDMFDTSYEEIKQAGTEAEKFRENFEKMREQVSSKIRQGSRLTRHEIDLAIGEMFDE